MRLLSDSIGRKAIVAVTGLCMVLFVVVHLLGNSTIFAGPDGINAYAEKLHGLGPFVWAFRAFMAAMLCLHVIFAVLLTLENRAANPDADHSRWVAPEEIAETVHFLCSPASGPISGAQVPVYGRA